MIGGNQPQSIGFTTELLLIQAGVERLQFVSARKNNPLQCSLDIRFVAAGQSGSVSFSIAKGGISVLEAKEAFDFLEALQYGGKIRFTFPTVGEKYQFDIPNQLAGEINPQYKDWVNKLVTIQNKTGVFLNLPENGLTYGDVENIEEVCSIVTNGVVTLSNRDMIISMSDDLISTLAQRKEEGKPPLRWRISHPDHSMDLLGEILSLGPTIQEFQGDYFGYEDNKKVVKEDSFYPVTFKNVTIEKRYPRWSASK